jgi:integrase
VANIIVRNGRRSIQFYDPNGIRKTVGLGKVTQKQAEGVKAKVEALCEAANTSFPLDDEVSQWLAKLGAAMLKKLTAVGLVPKRASATLGPFIDEYVASRIDVKPATKTVWSQVQRNLLDYFGSDRSLRSITAGDAENFKLYLIGEGLASATVAKRVQSARQFFNAARKHKLIEVSPFSEVRHKAGNEAARQFFVTPESAIRLLEAAPNVHWRVIIALSRWGGLRCPSEVLSLKWADIDWADDRMTVHSPKTAHHQGKESRIVPLFPELRPILEEAFELAPEGAVYVVDERYRQAALKAEEWKNCNLRTEFRRILRRAGLSPWPRLFHNMRGSRETELADEFAIQTVTAWLGNTPRIAMRHYLQVRESDFRRAVQPKAPQRAANALLQPAASEVIPTTDKGEERTRGVPERLWVEALNASPCSDLQAPTIVRAANVSPCDAMISGGHGIRTHNRLPGT